MIVSGTPISSKISYATVFSPSRKYGLRPVVAR